MKAEYSLLFEDESSYPMKAEYSLLFEDESRAAQLKMELGFLKIPCKKEIHLSIRRRIKNYFAPSWSRSFLGYTITVIIIFSSMNGVEYLISHLTFGPDFQILWKPC